MRHGKCWMQTRQSQLTNHNRQLRLSHPLKNRPLQLTNVRRHQCRYAHRRTVPSSGLIAFSPSGVYLRPFVTLFRHFVYAILFKSLRLLRLHLMQASALPSLAALITFGFHPDNGSMSAADNIVYAWHIHMPSHCFPVKFVIFSNNSYSQICIIQKIFVSLHRIGCMTQNNKK